MIAIKPASKKGTTMDLALIRPKITMTIAAVTRILLYTVNSFFKAYPLIVCFNALIALGDLKSHLLSHFD